MLNQSHSLSAQPEARPIGKKKKSCSSYETS